MIKQIVVTALAIGLEFSVSDAQAFDSYEHKTVGDVAIALAAALCPSEAPTSDCTAIAPYLRGGPPVTSLSYGDIVKCVDFFLTPEKLIAAARRYAVESDADVDETSAGRHKRIRGLAYPRPFR